MSNQSAFTKNQWLQIARLVLSSRQMDEVEEKKLVPEKKVLYQFSAKGHELGQVILGSLLDNKNDAAGAYYRSRPLLITLGISLQDALAGPLACSGGYSNGRDIGVVCNLPSYQSPTVLPMAGDVGSQYTPSAGWAQAIEYRARVLKDPAFADAIGVVLGGEGSVATNGFWSSLTLATTLDLPMLFYIEDNGYAISVPGEKQTPGGNIAQNLVSFKNLKILDDDGTKPAQLEKMLREGVSFVRDERHPALIRVQVPRLSGHSGQDNQAYKDQSRLAEERKNDPLTKLKNYLLENFITQAEWQQLEQEVERQVEKALEGALARPAPDTNTIKRHVFCEQKADGTPDIQKQGGLAPENVPLPTGSETPKPEGARINMVMAIRRTLESELSNNPRVLVFGEDVGVKGGVHAATMGLQEKFGPERVFDTSLSEEGIIGRAVGMALAGLMPVAEIQFRKYADPATEQLNNCGTIRWRTANRFAAPIVVRMPGGFAKCGDPWHSMCGESLWIHGIGWQVAFPSNAQDTVGLLRSAMRSNNPTIFFEHRALLDGAWARRAYPGDDFIVPFGKAKTLREGKQLTIVTWGAMVERCLQAAEKHNFSVEIIDLRTVSPWDKQAVISSVDKTKRCLIVHEDNITAALGAEISATLVKEAFFSLDAPIERVAPPDVPIPHNVNLMNAVIPQVEEIAERIQYLIEF